jgi:hypothetical protein
MMSWVSQAQEHMDGEAYCFIYYYIAYLLASRFFLNRDSANI